ncbi:hypothetical protein B7P43_G12573 [Cryptotermes secundus]|uniref:Tubulin epsilon and delta complex protein 1 domain-containing protein n=1 Tax=Cryptotermes secundus TaxID=105785 RepID=A0A2J7PZ58_9NEOP|nr:hypothetical protein B7P43_G12573 [Cryptotermes secundus]
MSDIKSVIGLLCKHLKLLFNVNVKPEHFRLSKFNNNEESCVCQMWEILYKMCKEVYPGLQEDDHVNFVKLSFAMMEYNSIEFYCLPQDMSFGSRELLISVGWLMLTSNVLEISTNRKLRESPMNMEFDVEGYQQSRDVPSQPVFKAGSLECTLNSILWIAGKIRHNVNSITETCQARVKFATKETVVAEKESDPHQNHLSVHEKRTLFHALDTLRHIAKACMLWCQRARSCNSMSDKDTDRSVSSPLHDLPLQPLRGLPRCILQAKGGHTEMGQLLTESELQLQDVRDMYRIKKAAVFEQLHQLARQTENVVLFPRLLK